MNALLTLLLVGQVCTSTPTAACEDALTFKLIDCQTKLDIYHAADTSSAAFDLSGPADVTPDIPEAEPVFMPPWWFFIIGAGALGAATLAGFGLGRL